MTHKLDIGAEDVHVPTAMPEKKSMTPAPNRKARRAAMAKKPAGKDASAKPVDAEKPGVGVVRRKGLHMKIGFLANGGHSLEIMHASDRVVHCDAVEFAVKDDALVDAEAKLATLADDAAERVTALAEVTRLKDAPVWNQVAKVGTFRGHPAGAFSLTPAVFDEIVKNFNDTVNRRVPLDFEHASEEEASSGSIPVTGAPAQGWITALENRGANGLWGLFEFLEPAKTYIREGRYPYFSPAIRFGAKDRVTGNNIGARLTSGAICTKPFLDGLQPLAAKDSPDQTTLGDTMLNARLMGSHDFMPKVRAALKLHELSTPADCKDSIGKLRELCGMSDGPGSKVHGVNLDDYLSPLASMMGLGANTTIEELLSAVEEMIESAMDQHVAEYHSGDSDMDDDDGGDAMKDTTMNDVNATTNDLAVKLGEEKSRADRAVTESAGLSLRLKDAESTVTTLSDKLKASEVIVGERDATIVALKAEIAKRDDDAAEERVNDAFDSYKDAKKLSDADKKSMRITLKADKALFDELYPRVAPQHKHLQRNLTTERTPTGVTAPGQQTRLPVSAPAALGQVSPTAVMLTLKDKYIKEGMEAEEAFKRAIRETRAAN
jgi:hypothetical protein